MSKFDFAWHCYENLQRRALHSRRTGDCSWGIDRGLDYLIAAIGSDTVPQNPQTLEANLKRAMASGARLERAHLSSLKTWLVLREAASMESEVDATAALARIVNAVTGPIDRQILYKTSLGYTDVEIAAHLTSTSGAIRIRLSRLRRKFAALRHSRAESFRPFLRMTRI
jgi:hypothetical protein